MPKVLYVISTLAEGGPVNQLYNIVSNIDSDISAVVLTLSDEPSNSRIDDFKSEVESVKTLGIQRNGGFVKGISNIRETVKKISPDIIHSHGFRADLISMISIRDIPIVSTIHTNPRYDYPQEYGRILGRIMAELHLLTVRGIDEPIACSDSIAKSIASFGPKLRSIRNGIDIHKFDAKSKNTHIRNKLGISANEPVFLSVGRFIKRKRPEAVIYGFENSNTNGTLIMVGKGPLLSECRALESNSVICTGFVQNIQEYFETADFFISASTAEGLPIAVMEALVSGIPVILSNIEPHAEILSINSNAGTLFDRHSVRDLSDSIKNTLNQNYHKMSTAAQNIIEEELNAERMVKEYCSIYKYLHEGNNSSF